MMKHGIRRIGENNLKVVHTNSGDHEKRTLTIISHQL